MKNLCSKITLLLSFALMCFQSYTSAQPNVLYIMADDLGWKDISKHGSDIPTPNIDRIFNQGVELSNFMAWAVCSPTRAGFLTGIHPLNSNMGPETNGHLGIESVTIADAFKSEGYRTGAFGKWHNGEACWKDNQGNPIMDVSQLPAPAKNKFTRKPYEYNVNDHGFDEWAGFYGGGTSYTKNAPDGNKAVYGIPNWFHNDLYVPTVWDSDPEYIDDRDGYVTDLIGDYAVKFINDSVNANKPFFCYVPFSAPHATPFSSLKYEYRNPNNPDNRIPNGRTGDDAKYAEMVILMDDQIGRIIDRLDAHGIKNQTIIIFTSDNGGTKMGNNNPFQGEKHTTWEGGYHVPTAVRWPAGGLSGGTTYSGLMGFLDMFPTLMSMCNLDMSLIPNDIDGKNIWDAQNSRLKTNSPVDSFFISFKNTHAIRTETFKYRMNESGAQALYNLTNDKGEANNIKNNNTTKFNELKAMANQFMNDNQIKLSHISHSIPGNEYATASGDVLRVRIQKTNANLNNDYYFQLSNVSPEPYVPGGHDSGHYLDYDIFVPNASKNMRFNVMLSSINASDSTKSTHWMENFGAKDSEGNSVSAFPNNGYSKAYGKWHKYRIGTGNYAPRNSGKLAIKLHKDSPTGTYDIFLDNAVLKNRQGNDYILWESDSSGQSIPNQNGVNVTISTVSSNFMVNNYGYNDSDFVSIDYPDVITPGMTFTANVTFANNGNSVWTNAAGYKLGSENVKDNTRWGVSRGLMDGAASVAPGETYTFAVECTAPNTPGDYNMQWSMIREGVEWFGETSNNRVITVVDLPPDYAEFVSQNIPASVQPGQSFNAELTFKNIGTTTWSAGAGYRLVGQDGAFGAGSQSVDVTGTVAPGASQTFIVPCVAPAQEGIFTFERQMSQNGGVGLFGDVSTSIGIRVIPQMPADLVDTTDEAGATISAEFGDASDAFDNSASTKYQAGNSSAWIQHQYAGGKSHAVKWYTLTSAAEGPLGGGSANLIQNGSFENGTTTPDNWNAPGGGLATLSGDNAQDGSKSLKLSTGSAQSISPTTQTVSLTQNTDYEIRFWALNSGQTAGRAVLDTNDVFDSESQTPGGNAQQVLDPGEASVWTEFVGSFNSASETSVTLRLFTNAEFTGTMYFDNLSLKALPVPQNPVPHDPASWTLQGSADGVNWNVIDSRSSVTFSSRGETMEFSAINNDTAYEYYRIEFVSNGGSNLQIAELELWAPVSSGPQDPGGDDDKDGLNNLLEYALGGDPLVSDSDIRLPITAKEASNFSMRFRRAESSVTYIIQTSTDLSTWTDYTTVNDSHGPVGSDATVYVPDTAMLNGKLFLRLRVEN